MEFELLDEAIELLEKANAGLEPELFTRDAARHLLDRYARLQRLAGFGVTALARKVNDPTEIARATGTPVGKAKETVATGVVLSECADLTEALRGGEISLEQAAEIAKAEESAPGSAEELLGLAEEGSFHVLRDEARRRVLDAEQKRGLGDRQRNSRSARSYTGELGMVHINLAFEPHVGTPFVNRAEAEAARLHRRAKKEDRPEPFERHLADAYAAMLSGSSVKPSAKRPELVVVVSHGVAKRGWGDVKDGEVCKIPGVGPVAPEKAKEIANDAFLTGVFCDGKDLREIKRWTRDIPIEVRTALELGEPPEFDGIKCVDCGNRFNNQNDHVEPHVARGPASVDNLKPRCRPCHQAKTARDREAGKLKPPDP